MTYSILSNINIFIFKICEMKKWTTTYGVNFKQDLEPTKEYKYVKHEQNTSVIYNWGGVERVKGGSWSEHLHWQRETKHIDRGNIIIFSLWSCSCSVASCVWLCNLLELALWLPCLSPSPGFSNSCPLNAVMPSNHISWKTNKLINILKINVSKINRQQAYLNI